MPVSYPQPGWAEQIGDGDLATACSGVIAEVVAQAGGADIAAIGISNQREIHRCLGRRRPASRSVPAIIWQCRRIAPIAATALRAAGHAELSSSRTGPDARSAVPGRQDRLAARRHAWRARRAGAR